MTGCVFFAVSLIFSAVVWDSGLSNVPKGFSWDKVTMRSLSVLLGFIRAWEYAKGEGPTGAASL